MTGVYDAIVLAGGSASRMSGAAKPQLSVGDATMLDRVLASVREASIRIVVGPPQEIPDGVIRVQEQPPGAGPVAALAAGLPRACAPVVVVLAADLPFVTPELIGTLIAGLGDQDDVALLVDDKGRDQYLLGAWRTARLRRALAELEPITGTAMKRLVRALRLSRVEVAVPHDAVGPWTDVDTPADLDRTRDWLRRHTP